MAYYVTVVAFLVTILMNKLMSIVIQTLLLHHPLCALCSSTPLWHNARNQCHMLKQSLVDFVSLHFMMKYCHGLLEFGCKIT